jgi:hypothetical protein
MVNAPQAVPLQPAPESDQVTPLLCVSFVSVAMKAFVPIPACTLALAGASVMDVGAHGVSVTVAVFDLVPSRFDVAVSVTAAGVGRPTGAV